LDTSQLFTPGETELARLTQEIRAMQSQRTTPWIPVTAVLLLWSFWHAAPRAQLITWLGLICLGGALRAVVCRRMLAGLKMASDEQLRKNEKWLLATGALNALIIGSGFWWVGVSNDINFVLLLLCCVYGVGIMVNTSVHIPSFVLVLLADMGQGILYFGGIGGETHLATAVTLVCATLLLIGFGRENARQFSVTVRTRLENIALVQRLEQEKLAVESALAERNHLLRAASHDLRGRVSTLNLHLANLDFTVTGEQARVNLDRTCAAAKGLHDLLDVLLNVSALDGRRVDIARRAFRIDALLEHMVMEYRSKANLKGLQLTLHAEPCTVFSNESQVERVLDNLITNAIKYTSQGGVTVSASVKDDQLHIAVEDTGSGIAAEDQQRVFDDFVRLRNRGSDGEPGVGLGLAIVRRLDRAMDLNLRLDSEPGRGSRFEFSLPMNDTHIEREAVEHGMPRSDRQFALSICIIEDDPNIRLGLREYLDSWGCVVQMGVSRRDLEAVLAHPDDLPDLFLCDDMLGGPEMGLDLCRWLSQTVPKSHIVMMSGNLDTVRTNEITGSGFRLLTKPLTERVLLELLVRVETRVKSAEETEAADPAGKIALR
jgi:signal transduction histidine kinase/CheY-like chemotaxis protein